MDNGEIDVLTIWDLKGYLEELKEITEDKSVEIRFRINLDKKLEMRVLTNKHRLQYNQVFTSIYDTHRPSFKHILDILSQEVQL